MLFVILLGRIPTAYRGILNHHPNLAVWSLPSLLKGRCQILSFRPEEQNIKFCFHTLSTGFSLPGNVHLNTYSQLEMLALHGKGIPTLLNYVPDFHAVGLLRAEHDVPYL